MDTSSVADFVTSAESIKQEFEMLRVLNPALYTKNFVDDLLWSTVRHKYIPSWEWLSVFLTGTGVDVARFMEQCSVHHQKFSRYSLKPRLASNQMWSPSGPESMFLDMSLDSDSEWVPASQEDDDSMSDTSDDEWI